jgi:hypothetical protein
MKRSNEVKLWLFLLWSVALAPEPVHADVVTDWNQTALNASGGISALIQSRNLALVHAAIFDAVNAVDRRHTSYVIEVNAKPGTSMEAAAAAAAYGVLTKLYWFQTPAFDVALEASLNAIPHGQSKTDGIAAGREVAEKLMASRAKDGSSASVTYAPKSGPGLYQLTPPALGPVVLPHWVAVTPFMLKSANQIELPGPPPYGGAEFAKDFNEVKILGARNSAKRTRDQTDAARFWTISGVVSDNDAARQLSAKKGLSVADNARLFALLNMAGADAYIACWEAKYRYNHWRPITAIRNADSAGNPAIAADPVWEPLAPTPAHPEYPAGHTCYGAATEHVLQAFFGDKVSLSLTNPAVKVTRTYHSLSQMGHECEDARVWGGMHFRTAVMDGTKLGHGVADYGLKNYLRPVTASDSK